MARSKPVLQGHAADVTSAEFTPDGRFVVTGSWDGTARVWAPSTARSLFALGHEGEIHSAKWSSDSQLIVTASSDGSARVWDSNGNLVSKLVGHRGELMSAEFSPDNSSIVTASRDNTGALWYPSTGHQIALLDGHADWVSSASFSPDGNFIVTTSGDYTARLWNRSGKEARTLSHNSKVECAAFSPNSEVLVTGDYDGTAKAWHMQTGESFLDLPKHTARCVSVAGPCGDRVSRQDELQARGDGYRHSQRQASFGRQIRPRENGTGALVMSGLGERAPPAQQRIAFKRIGFARSAKLPPQHFSWSRNERGPINAVGRSMGSRAACDRAQSGSGSAE